MRPWTAEETANGQQDWDGSFNGATALRPWTEVWPCDGDDESLVLQWGHGLAAVDG